MQTRMTVPNDAQPITEPLANSPRTDRETVPPSPRTRVDATAAVPLLVVHVLAVGLAPFTFSWPGLVTCVALYLFAGFGVTAGAHRLFVHRTFVPTPFLRELLALAFLMSGQGSLRRWVRDHAIHHRYADQLGDPHSPSPNGFWFAHVNWLWKEPATGAENRALYLKWTRDLDTGRIGSFFRTVPKLAALHAAIVLTAFGLGAIAGGWRMGLSIVAWGVFLRMVLGMHSAFFVNSATHLWGRRRYETIDGSRNLGWVAIVALGEGWHNNHHYRPMAANNGFHAWWEFDITFLLLVALGALRLLTDLKVFRPATGRLDTWFPSTNPSFVR